MARIVVDRPATSGSKQTGQSPRDGGAQQTGATLCSSSGSSRPGGILQVVGAAAADAELAAALPFVAIIFVTSVPRKLLN